MKLFSKMWHHLCIKAIIRRVQRERCSCLQFVQRTTQHGNKAGNELTPRWKESVPSLTLIPSSNNTLAARATYTSKRFKLQADEGGKSLLIRLVITRQGYLEFLTAYLPLGKRESHSCQQTGGLYVSESHHQWKLHSRKDGTWRDLGLALANFATYQSDEAGSPSRRPSLLIVWKWTAVDADI